MVWTQSKFTDATAVPETWSSWKQDIYVRQLPKYIKHTFHHKPKFSQMQVPLHVDCHVSLTYFSRPGRHSLCLPETPDSRGTGALCCSMSQQSFPRGSLPSNPKDTIGFSRMNLPLRLSATSPHARPEAHTVSTLQIPTLYGKAMGRHPAVRLCLPPCHPSSSFIWVSSKWHKRQSRMLPSL